MQLDGSMFTDKNLSNEEYDTNSDDEEELFSNNGIETEHELSFSSNNDMDSDDDMC